MSKIYTPKQAQQLAEAAYAALRLHGDIMRKDLKPIKSCLTLLEDLAAGKVEIKEIDDCKIQEPPDRNLYERVRRITRTECQESEMRRTEQVGWVCEYCRLEGWEEPE